MGDKKEKSGNDYKNEYLIEFKKLSDIELIKVFNAKVGITYFNLQLQGCLNAIHIELDRRMIDYSEIGNKSRISLANKMKLVDKKLIKK